MKKKRAKEIYSLGELQSWREVTRGIDPPIRLGVFGDPVAHSLSPQMQNAALKHHKIDMQYAAFQISPNELDDALKLVRELDFAGLNLTVPHKIAALAHVHDVDSAARKTGAVNVVANRSGKLLGFNTDGLGFSRALREEFAVDLRDLRVLLLGAGGAARAIAMQCALENCERLVIANRTGDKAKQLADRLSEFFSGPKVLGPVPRLQAIPWEEAAFRFQIANIDLIVNATPLGLNRTDPPPLAAHLLAPHLFVYDTVYARSQRPFVAAALAAGARAANGLSMLLHQGVLAFQLWCEREAPVAAMRAALS
ncbi:MAG: shikimate dehydrogenase [Verrucomicrobia bacterium]|nr:MAG: shikimate dehydrogenase [Verrucomicrobiota bacterium]